MSRLFMEEGDCVVDVKPIGLNMGFIEEEAEDHCVPTCPCPETSVVVVIVVSFFPSSCDTSPLQLCLAFVMTGCQYCWRMYDLNCVILFCVTKKNLNCLS